MRPIRRSVVRQATIMPRSTHWVGTAVPRSSVTRTRAGTKRPLGSCTSSVKAPGGGALARAHAHAAGRSFFVASSATSTVASWSAGGLVYSSVREAIPGATATIV